MINVEITGTLLARHQATIGTFRLKSFSLTNNERSFLLFSEINITCFFISL